MKLTYTLLALVAATPALAHPSMLPHDHDTTVAFSPLAAAAALAMVAVAVLAAPWLRAALTRVTAR